MNRLLASFLSATLLVALFSSCSQKEPPQATKWDKVTLTFAGPETAENAADNPFTNYRLNVVFSKGLKKMLVPGYYAADGNAGESSAEAGNVWKVHFRPDETGEWTYEASFRQGDNIAISDDPAAGTPVAFDGEEGKIVVSEGSYQLPDLRAKGRLAYVRERYLQFQETGEYFLKGGADSPENLLGYADFDGTYKATEGENRSGEAENKTTLHTYAPHAADWQEGDPTWQGGKGKNLIGGVNYLASKGMNSIYFLTMNIEGDGKDVWPYTSHEEFTRFDCSKLDQWEVVFDHMERKGMMLHIVTQETENEKLLDDGDTGPQRKLYYRELIARFGHHLAITWNMGEENGPANFSPNGQTPEQQKAMTDYFKANDPYQSFVVINTHAHKELRHEMFDRLLGHPSLNGPSIQVGYIGDSHEDTKRWVAKSAEAGNPWVVNIDEIGPANRGTDPDDREDNNQDTVRVSVLWGNLMAGGGGVEWYFGYLNHNNDLGCEDWRSRDRMWDYTKVALDFFQQHLPFAEMESHDELSGDKTYCLAKPGEVYAVFLPLGGEASLDLTGAEGTYTVSWYNPRTGGALQQTAITTVEGGEVRSLGGPPTEREKDWAVLVRVTSGE